MATSTAPVNTATGVNTNAAFQTGTDPNLIAATYSPGLPSQNTPTNVATIGSAPNITLPQPSTATPYDISSLPSIANLLNPAPTAADTKQTQLENQLLTDTRTLGTRTAAQNAAETAAGLPDLNKQLVDINGQITSLQAEAARQNNTSQDRLAPTFAINGEQAQIERARSVKALGLSAIAQTLQGNIALAQQTANKAVETQFAPIQADINYLTQAIALNKDTLSKEDQKRATQLQVALQDRQTQLDQAKADKTTILGWAAEAATNGASSVILNQAMAASDPGQALQLLGSYLSDPVAKQQALANLAYTRSQTAKNNANATASSTTTPGYNGDFAATISLAANADSKATNATKTAVTKSLQGYIANGDYKSAYQTIVQQTKAGLTGANATTFENAKNLGSVLTDLQTALQAYANAGGDTNILKGNLDSVGTKVGALLNDPKYKSIAVQLDTAFQNYRHVMTGANFSAAESNSYASVLPSKSNTIALNLATIDGAKAAANSTVEADIKNVVGQGGVYIKQYAEGATPQAQTAPADPVFSAWLKTNGLSQ